VGFSAEVEEARRPRAGFGFWSEYRWKTVVATATVTAIIVFGFTAFRSRGPHATFNTGNDSDVRWARQQDILKERIATLEESVRASSERLADVQRTASIDGEALMKAQNQLAVAQEEAHKLEIDLEKSRSEYAELMSSGQQKDALVANLRAQNERELKENASNLSTVIIQEARIRELNNALELQASNFERERELMIASKDVRQLMGARNLHIMDVHDTNGAGRSAKAFGRVFYSDGQSLIFYAFDLPSGKLTPAKYTFQAWGQKESVSHSVRNLGTFSVDDHDQRRWVLEVNDPKLLQGIDSVFVTAEVLGDTGEPRGKKILYAYIVGEPNHP
jgi:hypothetical protein